MAAPVKVFPHTLEVAFSAEDWTLISELSVLANAPKSAVVRAAFKRGVEPLREAPMPERYRDQLAPVGLAVTAEVGS